MEDNTNKHINDLVDKMLQDAPLESPSFDFTNNVMSKIETLEQTSNSSVTTYKPLISKTHWLLIAASIIVVIVYSYFGGETSTGSGWLNQLNLSNLSFNNPLKNITFSKTTMYALVLFSVFLFVQMPLFNKRFDKSIG